ncbi:MAG: hypothetical protein JNL83_16330 [Myxococcales bacterium]|nr:hypothetical protein [Myxococcales bacterium]
MRTALLAALALLLPRLSDARDARVTATTRTTIYIDAGTADGLVAGRVWTSTVAGAARELRVVAAASHSAVVELAGPLPAVGTAITLPADLAPPPAPAALRPPPAVIPAWRGDPSVMKQVRRAADAGDEAPPTAARSTDRVRGEIALSAYVAGDAGETSTSWQDLALSSQLEVISGPWQYDHVLEAHLVGAPDVFYAPLQHASARLDVYLLRLAYAPAGARYAASLGRQPGAPLGELGSVDGGRARLVLGGGADLTVFGGVRPSDDLGLTRGPRAGADLGWSYVRGPGVRARADLGVAVDARGGALDRLQSAGSLSLARGGTYLRGDAVVDLADDAAGQGSRLTRASALARVRTGRLATTVQGGYDRPFLDHALAAALGDLTDLRLGPRTFGEIDTRYALRGGLEVGALARGAWGDDVWSGYGEVRAVLARLPWSFDVAPHAVVGTLTDEVGVRAGVHVPVLRWQLGLGGSVDRVTAGVATAWAGLGRVSASRSFLTRWRTSLAVEAAAGDGPPRVVGFALLAYRLGE